MAGDAVRRTTLPQLPEMMRSKGVSYVALAEQSGLNKSTVWKAKRGCLIRISTAALLLQTIEERF